MNKKLVCNELNTEHLTINPVTIIQYSYHVTNSGHQSMKYSMLDMAAK